MAKGTILLILFLVAISSLLFGISIGKRIGLNLASVSAPTPTMIPKQPSPSPTPMDYGTTSQSTQSNTSLNTINGVTYFTDRTCGYTFSIPSSHVEQKTSNNKSTILADPDNQDEAIATTCAPDIPEPPVTAANTETVTISDVSGTLYHDKNPDGSPRDEVIIKHPTNGMEIIIAGYGDTFQQVLSSFSFL